MTPHTRAEAVKAVVGCAAVAAPLSLAASAARWTVIIAVWSDRCADNSHEPLTGCETQTVGGGFPTAWALQLQSWDPALRVMLASLFAAICAAALIAMIDHFWRFRPRTLKQRLQQRRGAVGGSVPSGVRAAQPRPAGLQHPGRDPRSSRQRRGCRRRKSDARNPSIEELALGEDPEPGTAAREQPKRRRVRASPHRHRRRVAPGISKSGVMVPFRVSGNRIEEESPMTRRALQAFIVTLLAVAVSVAGVAVAVAEDPPPDEQVNLRCVYESLIGVPVDDHPDTDTLCFRLARNQNCTGTGESRVCDDETPWPEFTIPPLTYGVFHQQSRTDAERTQIRAAYIVERSLAAGCDHYTTSDELTAGAYRLICLSQTVSRAQVIACQAAVTALSYRRVHDIYVDYETFNCPAAPGSSTTQSQRQTRDTAHVVADEPETDQQQSDDQQPEATAHVVVAEVDEPEIAQQQSDDQQPEATAHVVVAEVDEPEIAQQQSDDQQPEATAHVVVAEVDEPEIAQQQSDDQQPEATAHVVVAEVDEPEIAQQQSDDQQPEATAHVVVAEVDEPEIAQQQSDDQQPKTRLAWIASEVARKTGQSCSVIDGRVTCTP